MAEADIDSLLVVGIDVASLATSATRAGYEVYAVDYFGDQDLKRVCHESRSIVEQRPGVTCGDLSTSFDPEALLQLTKELVKKKAIDATLLSSGLDDYSDFLFELNDTIPILGNHPYVIKRVRDKTEFFHELRRLRIPHPETAIVRNLKEGKETAKDIGYPVLVKPSRGFGGVGIRKVKEPQGLEKAFRNASLFDGKVLIQEFVSGLPVSISMISSADQAITLTLNEQILGISEFGQEEPFGYSGNVVPFVATRTVFDECKNIAERITSNFALIGSNGIDLVITEEGKTYVVEVNPRFQGTIECVERTLDINIVKAHVEACVQGTLPTIKENLSTFCVRLILLAPEDSVVPDLSLFKEVRDIPLPNVIIEKGEPLCSVVVEGKTRSSALRKARVISRVIYGKLQL